MDNQQKSEVSRVQKHHLEALKPSETLSARRVAVNKHVRQIARPGPAFAPAHVQPHITMEVVLPSPTMMWVLFSARGRGPNTLLAAAAPTFIKGMKVRTLCSTKIEVLLLEIQILEINSLNYSHQGEKLIILVGG